MRISQFSLIASSSPIEAATGIIRGVSVIKEGLAEGHDLWIDSKTISDLLALCKGQTIKVKINHPAKADAPLETTAGQLENFRVDGQHLRADLCLLRSGDYFDQIVEMSQKMPDKFGLSVRIGQDIEKKDGKEFCRPISIESVDLVDSPAANIGLFSKKAMGGDHAEPGDEEPMKASYEEDGKTHKKDCMCKSCKMSKKSKSMSAIFAKAFGLADTATDEEIVAAFAKRAPADLTELQRKMDATTAELAELKKRDANGVALAKKAEIDNLMTEAARDGKVVPLDNEDLYTVVNGTVTIKTEPTQLSKMISKLPKGQVSLPAKRANLPVDKDNKPIEFDRRTAEGRAKQIAFSKERQMSGATSLGEFMRKQVDSGNTN